MEIFRPTWIGHAEIRNGSLESFHSAPASLDFGSSVSIANFSLRFY